MCNKSDVDQQNKISNLFRLILYEQLKRSVFDATQKPVEQLKEYV